MGEGGGRLWGGGEPFSVSVQRNLDPGQQGFNSRGTSELVCLALLSFR